MRRVLITVLLHDGQRLEVNGVSKVRTIAGGDALVLDHAHPPSMVLADEIRGVDVRIVEKPERPQAILERMRRRKSDVE